MILRKAGNFIPSNTEWHRRRLEPSVISLCEPQISQVKNYHTVDLGFIMLTLYKPCIKFQVTFHLPKVNVHVL